MRFRPTPSLRPVFLLLLGLLAAPPARASGPSSEGQSCPPRSEPQGVIQVRDTLLVGVAEHRSCPESWSGRTATTCDRGRAGVRASRAHAPAGGHGGCRGLTLRSIVDTQVSACGCYCTRPHQGRRRRRGRRRRGATSLTRDQSLTAGPAVAGGVRSTEFAGRDRIYVVRAAEREPRVRFRLAELTAPQGAPFRLHDGERRRGGVRAWSDRRGAGAPAGPRAGRRSTRRSARRRGPAPRREGRQGPELMMSTTSSRRGSISS